MRYVFDPDVLHNCTLGAVGLPREEMIRAVEDAMERAYPGRIWRDQPWIYSNAGGAMIQMKVYFASVFEYVIIWGTPIGSEGHSGRHLVGFWDTILEGEAWYYAEGQLHRRVYRPGDRVYVGPGQARGMRFSADLWALEYARGPIPLSLPFGLADELVSTLDFATALQTVGVYATLLGRHWTSEMAFGPTWLRSLKKMAGILPRSLGPHLTRLAAPAPATDDIPDGSGHMRSPEELGLGDPVWRERDRSWRFTPGPEPDDRTGAGSQPKRDGSPSSSGKAWS